MRFAELLSPISQGSHSQWLISYRELIPRHKLYCKGSYVPTQQLYGTGVQDGYQHEMLRLFKGTVQN
jgi:hypothetical protein